MRRVLSFFSMAILVLATSCGSGGGTPVPDDEPGPFPPVVTEIDPMIAMNTAEILASPDDPDAALQHFQGEIARVFAEEADTRQAVELIVHSYLSEIRSPADWESLLTAMKNAPDVYAPQPVISSLGGAGVDCPPLEGGTVVYFVNGIWNTPQDAMSSRQALEYELERAGDDIPRENIRLFYNKSGLSSESIDSFCEAYAIGVTRWAHGVLLRDLFENLYQRACAATVGSLADLAEAAAQKWLLYSPGPADRDVTGLRHVIQQDILSGKKVIVVAHSQGNLFVQEAVDGLPSDSFGAMQGAVGVVAVASPADYPRKLSYGSFSYLTLEGDIVDRLFPASFHPNGANDVSDDDVLGFATHSFVESYIGLPRSRNRILSMIWDAEAHLFNRRTDAGQGFFQVTLTWDAPGDIDLHVFEPTGEHVWWNNTSGSAGKLDRDDLEGTGPENYFVCSRDAMVGGTYTIRVSNYLGVTGTVADVLVRAGTQVRAYRETLGPPDRGSDRVRVTQVTYNDNDGTFSFSE